MANLSNINNKFLVTTGGNVGIGTTSPTQLLTVWGGNVYLRGGDSKVIINNIAGASNNEDILFQRNDSTKFSLGLNSSDSFTLFGSSTSTSHLTVNSSGNVGIGTAAPDSPLEIEFAENTGTIKQMLHLDYNPVNNYGSALFKISAGTNSAAVTQIEQVTSGGNGSFGTYQDTNIINRGVGGISAGNINFITGSNTSASSIVMTIGGGSQKGNVGIGTISPGQKLAIEGGGTANENILRVNNQGQVSSRIWLRNAGQSAYIFNSGPTPDTLATNILGQAFGMGINNNSSIQFYNGATASVKMTILPSGNVGIGRTQADEKLEVEGNIKAKDVDGKIYSMVASWSYVASKNDLFSFAGTEGAVWEYTIRMNPNTAGSGAYRDFYYGKLGIGIGWNGSNVTQYMWQQQDQTAPRTLYSSGGGNFNPLFRMYYSGGIYTELALNTAWTLRIQGLSTTTYGDIFFRRLA